LTIAGADAGAIRTNRPPAWLIACTGALALVILALAVAETNLKAHYLIDQGEFISIFGLVFIAGASLYLYRARRLLVSLPLVFPWVLYPVITQGDEIIDNLSIDPMRIICHVLLAAIFATPVAVLVVAARYALSLRSGRSADAPRWTAFVPGLRQIAEGRLREGSALFASALLVAETWLADQYLGTLMIVTIIIMTIAVLVYGTLPERDTAGATTRGRSERFALVVALGPVVLSAAAFVGYKNRPGAYQGSPSFFMDPSQKNAAYRLDRIVVPSQAPAMPADPAAAGEALTAYAHTLDKLIAGYHILDRNYTYDFHNELFLRHTPLVANYRTAGLALVEEARRLHLNADARAATVRAALGDGDPIAALLDDLRAYLAFMFDRAPTLERLSAGFAQTPAGLQHAAHLYEGEAKYMATVVAQLMEKHRAVFGSPAVASITGDLKASGHAIDAMYANRVVGF
jgi:hypothetical protein